MAAFIDLTTPTPPPASSDVYNAPHVDSDNNMMDSDDMNNSDAAVIVSDDNNTTESYAPTSPTYSPSLTSYTPVRKHVATPDYSFDTGSTDVDRDQSIYSSEDAHNDGRHYVDDYKNNLNKKNPKKCDDDEITENGTDDDAAQYAFDVKYICGARYDAFGDWVVYDCVRGNGTKRWLARASINNDPLIRKFWEHEMMEDLFGDVGARGRRFGFAIKKLSKRQLLRLKKRCDCKISCKYIVYSDQY